MMTTQPILPVSLISIRDAVVSIFRTMDGPLFQWCFRLIPFILLIGTGEGSPAMGVSRDADYWGHRGRILAEESYGSLGGRLRFRNGERAANVILMTAKENEIDLGFQDPTSFLPARNFLTCGEEVSRSETFRIIQKMPKGGALHVHDIALASSQFVYENITFRDNLYVCRPTDGSILYKFSREAENDTTCEWELLADLRANASVAQDIEDLVKKSLTMVVPDPAKTYPNNDIAWVAFAKIFRTLYPLIHYYPIFEDFIYQGLTEMYNDNVFYIELRTTFSPLYDLDGNIYGHTDITRLYKNITHRFIKDHPDFVGVKLIFALSRRRLTAKQLDEHLAIMTELKREFPDFVAGCDLVGQENRGEPLVRFVDKLKAISPDIKLFLHAGETNWNGLSTDENLIDAVLLNATRIGHGYALLKHPRVLELAQQHGVAIEINPISNQVLTLVNDMRNHPASYLFARNYPLVVSSDDPGLWGAVGLSYDFYEAFVGIMSRSADLRALKQLAINSIKYSAMSNEEKIYAQKIWKRKWKIFIRNLAYN